MNSQISKRNWIKIIVFNLIIEMFINFVNKHYLLAGSSQRLVGPLTVEKCLVFSFQCLEVDGLQGKSGLPEAFLAKSGEFEPEVEVKNIPKL